MDLRPNCEKETNRRDREGERDERLDGDPYSI